MKEEIIKQKVKENYGKTALVANSSEGFRAPTSTECCGGNDNTTMTSPLQFVQLHLNNFIVLESACICVPVNKGQKGQ